MANNSVKLKFYYLYEWLLLQFLPSFFLDAFFLFSSPLHSLIYLSFVIQFFSFYSPYSYMTATRVYCILWNCIIITIMDRASMSNSIIYLSLQNIQCLLYFTDKLDHLTIKELFCSRSIWQTTSPVLSSIYSKLIILDWKCHMLCTCIWGGCVTVGVSIVKGKNGEATFSSLLLCLIAQ